MEKRSSQSSLSLSCTGIFHTYLNKHPQDRKGTSSAQEETPKTFLYPVNTTSPSVQILMSLPLKSIWLTAVCSSRSPVIHSGRSQERLEESCEHELSNSSKRTPCSAECGALCRELPCCITEKGTCGDLSQHTMLSQVYIFFLTVYTQPVKVSGVLGSVWVAPSAQRYEVPAVCSVLTLVKH